MRIFILDLIHSLGFPGLLLVEVAGLAMDLAHVISKAIFDIPWLVEPGHIEWYFVGDEIEGIRRFIGFCFVV